MPRGGRVRRKHQLNPDEKYNSKQIARFINYVMLDGKKEKAKNIVYRALETAGTKLEVDPVDAFKTALAAVKPDVEVRSRRVGGATYQIPVPVPTSRAEALSMRWIIDAARSRSGRPMEVKLADELINASNGEGDAVTKKENTHKMAEANRAFGHFKW